MIETIAAFFLLVCLACFFSANLHNLIIIHKRRGRKGSYAEIKRPEGFIVVLAAAGTVIYFLEVLLYLSLVFSGLLPVIDSYFLLFDLSFWIYIKVLGLILTSIGYFLFIWSVVVRGEYAVSWEMPENQDLVIWGPYRHVRHPSYLGYFLMFSAFFFIWPNPLTLFPLLAIPGYIRITSVEEELLMKRFGEEYLEYKKKTGQFIPKLQ